MSALAVYALAALTVFALLYRHALDGFMRRDSFYVFLAVLVAVLWPLYLPALAFDWIIHKRAARRSR